MQQRKRTKKSDSRKKRPSTSLRTSFGRPSTSLKATTIKFKSHKDLPFCAMSLTNTLYNKTGSWRSLKPIVHEDKCISCLLCWKFCPEPCITMINGIPHIDYDYCKGCGICIEVCPKDAITFEEEKR